MMNFFGAFGLNNSSQEKAQPNLILEEIKDYEEGDVKEILANTGILSAGIEITKTDYEAIKNRAVVLNKENSNISANNLILTACLDRLANENKFSKSIAESMSNESIKKALYFYTKDISDEEVEMFRQNAENYREWLEKRKQAKQEVKDKVYAVKDNTVIAEGQTDTEAMLKAGEQVK